MIYKYRWLLLIIFFAGLVILLIPDNNATVIKLNKEHGPSIPDLAGLFLMAISWLLSTIFIAENRADLKNKMGKQIFLTLIVIYLSSIAGIVAGLLFSIEWMLWVSVIAASIINFLFIIAGFKFSIRKHNMVTGMQKEVNSK
jgi:drug/metabolite transporter (DMT)-like permease